MFCCSLFVRWFVLDCWDFSFVCLLVCFCLLDYLFCWFVCLCVWVVLFFCLFVGVPVCSMCPASHAATYNRALLQKRQMTKRITAKP